MTPEAIRDVCKQRTLFSWSARGALDPMVIERAEGVHFTTADGKRYLDLNSQLMSVHIGHAHPRVLAAMRAATNDLVYCAPSAVTRQRAELSELLATLLPEELGTFFFTLAGADANENAIRMAHQFTGRQKILARHRSYHGATHRMLAISGDSRRERVPPLPGVVHVDDPWSLSFESGGTPDDYVDRAVSALETTIENAGPNTFAAMIVEVVPGSNGILPPPTGYLAKVKALLERHGILMICDEVMTGFGRTGKMFAFEHEGFVPDLVTMAKGLTSSYVPLGGVAIHERIARHFDDHVYWGGLTYNAHAYCLGVAKANVEVIVDERLADNAARVGDHLEARVDAMKRDHPSIRELRRRGLFAAIELKDPEADAPLSPVGAPLSAAAKSVVGGLKKRGVYALMRWSNLFVVPPLCITTDELDEGLDAIESTLHELEAN
ncbi:MAG: aminotransferase class III-fold pyridoxal phosphate-dependent enzyme [Deltaproteobacteria bacterium]|jgi:taurine--2-oxoglutarate transaminase